MRAHLVSHCKTRLVADNGHLVGAEVLQRRNNNRFAPGKLKLLEASYMHLVDKQLVRRPCSAKRPSGNLAEPRTQEVLLNDHCFALGKLRDGCAGWEFFAELVVIEM